MSLERTTSYENRFRDPVFIEAWMRFRKASREWDKVYSGEWWKVSYDLDRYVPDLEPLQGEVRAAAEEYLNARTSYKALVKEYLDAEVEDG